MVPGRQQQVIDNSTLSDLQVKSTGAPQRCVSSPPPSFHNAYKYMIKFSDIAVYVPEIVRWCEGAQPDVKHVECVCFKITSEPNHILHKENELTPLGRRYRLKQKD